MFCMDEGGWGSLFPPPPHLWGNTELIFAPSWFSYIQNIWCWIFSFICFTNRVTSLKRPESNFRPTFLFLLEFKIILVFFKILVYVCLDNRVGVHISMNFLFFIFSVCFSAHLSPLSTKIYKNQFFFLIFNSFM